MSELLIHPSIYQDKSKLNLVNTLYDRAIKKIQAVHGKYLRVYKSETPKKDNTMDKYEKSFNQNKKPFGKQMTLDKYVVK